MMFGLKHKSGKKRQNSWTEQIVSVSFNLRDRKARLFLFRDTTFPINDLSNFYKNQNVERPPKLQSPENVSFACPQMKIIYEMQMSDSSLSCIQISQFSTPYEWVILDDKVSLHYRIKQTEFPIH